MTESRNQPHAICGAKRRDGKPCQARPMPNGRCRMHGGPSTGPKNQQGNTNAKKHGLFAQSLDDVGLVVYQRAKEMGPEVIAKDTAEFLVAQVAQAFHWSDDLEAGFGTVRSALMQAVENGQISRDAALKLLNRLNAPDIASLGKALGPLKGLLEVKKASEGETSDDSLDDLMDAIQKSRQAREGQ